MSTIGYSPNKKMGSTMGIQQTQKGSQIQMEAMYLTQGLGQNNSSSLKGKLQNLDDLVKIVSSDLDQHRKELSSLKNSKDSLENSLSGKLYDINKTLTNELARLCDDMKKQYQYETSENSKVQVLIITMKAEKQAIREKLETIEKRIQCLEENIGKNKF